MSRSFIAIALLLVVGLASASHDFAGPNTVELTTDNYEELTGNGKVYMVAYFAPWCGHCKKLAPTWGEIGAKLAGNPNVVTAFIDCTQHRDICTKADVKGYPTIKVIHKNEEYKTYRGARDTESLSAFLVECGKDLTTETA